MRYHNFVNSTVSKEYHKVFQKMVQHDFNTDNLNHKVRLQLWRLLFVDSAMKNIQNIRLTKIV
jgi:hypothetical protein